MNGRIVALDTETTGLDPETEDVFEIAAIDLDTKFEYVWRIEPRRAVVLGMHPRALEVNRFDERTKQVDWIWDDPYYVLDMMRKCLDGAHILGAVPDFDARHITALYRRFGEQRPSWHYHLIDIEALAVGYLQGQNVALNLNILGDDPALTLPWKSDDLARACGVEPPSDAERHTALGDARWVERWYRKIFPDDVSGDVHHPDKVI